MAELHTSIVWMRRDLRCFDHAALSHALQRSDNVVCMFIFDKAILDPLARFDRRVEFIHASLLELDAELRKVGSGLVVRHANAVTEIPKLAAEFEADAVFINRDYEPTAIQRDAQVAAALQQAGRQLFSFKDQVIFEPHEVLSQQQTPFSIYTPYKNAWLKKLHLSSDSTGDQGMLAPFLSEPLLKNLRQQSHASEIPSLAQLGFEKTNLTDLPIPTGMTGGQSLLDDFLPRMGRYDQTRNFPSVKGSSYLSVHLRFGTVSIRGLARRALQAMHGFAPAGSDAQSNSGCALWLSELIWRDFYFMILFYAPHVVTRSFKPAYDAIQWQAGEYGDQLFNAWCNARTGYPLVDAAMLQINQTGYMHNRLRMVTACFLIKDFGINWQRGERYFAEQLNDYDLAANNGGWQWASSSGCDAQPYFRIFNPVTQSEKFDADGKFIKRYLPQLAHLTSKEIHAPWLVSPERLKDAGVVLGQNYPHPMVMHEAARQTTLARYQIVKKNVGAFEDA